jgi:general secretion pathway protein G
MKSHRIVTRAARRAFTLIELLLVLVILGVLAAVVVPKLVGRGEQARVTRAGTDIANLSTVLDTYETDNGHYPSNDEGLNALLEPPANVQSTWKGPYISQPPMDPWQHPYIYRFPGAHNPRGFDLSSMGPDGQEGTADDITSWQNKQ